MSGAGAGDDCQPTYRLLSSNNGDKINQRTGEKEEREREREGDRCDHVRTSAVEKTVRAERRKKEGKRTGEVEQSAQKVHRKSARQCLVLFLSEEVESSPGCHQQQHQQQQQQRKKAAVLQQTTALVK